MKISYRVLLFITSLLILTSCSFNKPKEPVEPPKITIETYNTFQTTTTPEETSEPITTTAPITTTEPSSDLSNESTSDTESTTSIEEVTTVPTAEEEVPTTVSTEETSIDDLEIIDYECMMYSITTLNVREFPNADSDRVGRYYEGDEVIVTGLVSNGWMRVLYEGKTCYVSGRYLSDTYESEEEVTTAATEATTVNTENTTIQTSEDDYEVEIDIDIDSNSYNALNYKYQKAVWFAYLDIDRMLAGASENEFTKEIREAFQNVKYFGCNTVYVHVRAFGDAYYKSDYYAFAPSYSGKMGVSPDFDPLKIMIDEAHKLGLSFHAWVNPMRTTTESRYKEMSSSYQLKKWYNSSSTNGEYIVYDEDSTYYWLSPAYPAVRELICNGIAEIVSNYNVDAIHIDDYFYPTTDSSFDKEAFKASGSSDLASWRRNTVSRLVKEMYSTVKSCNPSVLFGISPAGNVDNNMNKYYADVIRWCSEDGFMDYVTPQIYYNYDDKLQFDNTVLQWQSLVKEDSISLVCGIAAYKVGLNKSWSKGDVLSDMTSDVLSLKSYDGLAYYRYDMMFNPADDVEDLMNKEISKLMILLVSYE